MHIPIIPIMSHKKTCVTEDLQLLKLTVTQNWQQESKIIVYIPEINVLDVVKMTGIEFVLLTLHRQLL